MFSKRKKIYADDLVDIYNKFSFKSNEIKTKLCDDKTINQGLFLMTSSLFEDSIREIIRLVLISFPEKLKIKSCTITKEQVCEIANIGYKVIIDNELFLLFKDGVKKQLEYLFEILLNIDKKNDEPKYKEITDKIFDISLYRNSLIHNGGKASKILKEKAIYYKITNSDTLNFDKKTVEKFINDYISLFIMLENETRLKYQFYENKTRIEKLRNIWNECFSSPILDFDSYWQIDYENDLIIGINYPEYESAISSSEKVLLSIWRHQYNDSIKTEEFLLCSVNYHKICKLYEGLDEMKIYHMYEEARYKMNK